MAGLEEHKKELELLIENCELKSKKLDLMQLRVDLLREQLELKLKLADSLVKRMLQLLKLKAVQLDILQGIDTRDSRLCEAIEAIKCKIPE